MTATERSFLVIGETVSAVRVVMCLPFVIMAILSSTP